MFKLRQRGALSDLMGILLATMISVLVFLAVWNPTLTAFTPLINSDANWTTVQLLLGLVGVLIVAKALLWIWESKSPPQTGYSGGEFAR